MIPQITRREFLKLAAYLPGGAALAHQIASVAPDAVPAAGQPNVIIVLFDALSALNMSLYGYGRDTTPNIVRLADRAIVYHDHYAASNWTGPSTASLLTGLLPWSHGSLNMTQPVHDDLIRRNVFHAFRGHHRIAYTHNPLVELLLSQFNPRLDEHVPLKRLYLQAPDTAARIFAGDPDIARVGSRRILQRAVNGGYAYSLLLSGLLDAWQENRFASVRDEFPRGLPNFTGDDFFVLETAMEYLTERIEAAPRPYFAYLHFLPPHQPYSTRRDFVDRFKDDSMELPVKPLEAFANPRPAPGGDGDVHADLETLLRLRREYDEYILYADSEFGRFFARLESSGVLENTWLVLTSDHGELFERGLAGHDQPVMYQPEIRVPLLIFEPGRTSRLDVREPTSTIDLLPTLLRITGGKPAPWAQGSILPPFGPESPAAPRSIFAAGTVVRPWDVRPSAPVSQATLTLLRKPLKVSYFFGYPELGASGERVDLYDIEADPEELNNLSGSEPATVQALLRELLPIRGLLT